jgi:hypothetical protein
MKNRTSKIILPSDLSPVTRQKLFDFVDAICSEIPELDSKLKAGILRVTNGILEFSVRPSQVNHLERWFWKMVQRNAENSCWEWQGCRDENGYGLIKVAGRRILAHRIALILVTGSDSELFGLHKCDNPPCVSPFHLYRGGYDENARDIVARNRRTVLRGRDHPLTRVLTFEGQSYSLDEWKAKLGISQAALHKRLRRWSLSRALTVPPRQSPKNKTK